MYYPIITTTTYARRLLEGETEGAVHSVYRNTVNLRIGAGLLAVQSAVSPVSPLSLITNLKSEAMASLAILPGQAVRLEKDRLSIDTASGFAVFSYKDAEIFDTALMIPPLDFSPGVLCSHIKKALPALETGGFQLLFTTSGEQDSLILGTARKRLKETTALLQNGAYSDAAAELTRITGLGIGLTPSGDDFLCGVLAGLILTGRHEHPFTSELHRCVRLHLTDTNDLSAAFLTCALEGHYSLAIKSLCRLPFAGELIHLFSEIGHSSGTDTLCGVLYALLMDF